MIKKRRNNMKKHEFIQTVANQTGLTQTVVQQVLNCTFDTIVRVCVDEGEEIGFVRFGKFKRKSLPARKAVNPKTGEKISVPATHSLHFTPSYSLRKEV